MAKFPLSKGGGPLLADTFTHSSTHFLIKIILVQYTSTLVLYKFVGVNTQYPDGIREPPKLSCAI